MTSRPIDPGIVGQLGQDEDDEDGEEAAEELEQKFLGLTVAIGRAE